MNRNDYTDADYRQPHVPPGTPPTIDPNADAKDAATLTMDSGDSDAPGSQPAHFERGAEDDALFAGGGERGSGGNEVRPGQQPDEVTPGQGDFDQPDRTPDEFPPDQGDIDQPETSPDEMPAVPDTAPLETPPPPD